MQLANCRLSYFAMRSALLIADAFFAAWLTVYGTASGQVDAVNSDLETDALGNVGLDPALLQALTADLDADRYSPQLHDPLTHFVRDGVPN